MHPRRQPSGTRKRVTSSECEECLELRQRCNELERINSEHEATIARLQKSLAEAEMKANRFENLYRNEWWDYSLQLPGLDKLQSGMFGYYDEEEASRIHAFLMSLREIADDMRRGKLIREIDLSRHTGVLNEELEPYWEQFVDALTGYKFVLDYHKADGFNFKIDGIELPSLFLDMLL